MSDLTTQSNTGGAADAPAFPVVAGHQVYATGLTMRDWFAGQALAGIMGPNYDWFTSGTETGSRTHEAAHFAYSLADAMLAARAALTQTDRTGDGR